MRVYVNGKHFCNLSEATPLFFLSRPARPREFIPGRFTTDSHTSLTQFFSLTLCPPPSHRLSLSHRINLSTLPLYLSPLQRPPLPFYTSFSIRRFLSLSLSISLSLFNFFSTVLVRKPESVSAERRSDDKYFQRAKKKICRHIFHTHSPVGFDERNGRRSLYSHCRCGHAGINRWSECGDVEKNVNDHPTPKNVSGNDANRENRMRPLGSCCCRINSRSPRTGRIGSKRPRQQPSEIFSNHPVELFYSKSSVLHYFFESSTFQVTKIQLTVNI